MNAVKAVARGWPVCRSYAAPSSGLSVRNMSSGKAIEYTVTSDCVATITMNAPGNRNALSSAMMTALSESLLRASAHDKAKVVVLRAVGPAFCAGHDLKELRLHQESNLPESSLALFQQCSDLMLQIHHLPMPVIAAVHAVATAAGCQLAASCDIVLATTSATFATPGVNIGLFCTTPAVALSRAVGAKKAAEMLFTGLPQSATDMRIAGLVNTVVDGDVHEAADALAHVIAAKPTTVVALGKKAFYAQLSQPLEHAYAFASNTMCDNLLNKADAREGIGAFLAKRTPHFS